MGIEFQCKRVQSPESLEIRVKYVLEGSKSDIAIGRDDTTRAPLYMFMRGFVPHSKEREIRVKYQSY